MSNDVINEIKNSQNINADCSFRIAKQCLNLRNSKETQVEAQNIIIYILENWQKVNENSKQIWIDIIESMGFYPYLEKYKEILKLNNTASIIRKGYFKSHNLPELFLHEEQKEILNKIQIGKNMIVSAPTSFGKSLLIEEVVASNVYKNIVVIQPTLALLDETRKKLSKYKEKYKIIVKTSQLAATDKGNIFLLTAERVLEYHQLPQIEFLVLDEFYKLSAKRDDERSDILNNAFHLLLTKHNCKFILLGPNIEGISKGFAKRYNAEFYRTQYSLVVNEEVDCFSTFIGQFGQRGMKKQFKEEKLFELLIKLQKDQTIVFCSSPSRVRYLSKQYTEYLIRKGSLEIKHVPMVEWIRNNVNKNWSLIKCLNYRIGIHDGGLPKHITSSIIKYFNEKILNCLFCTTTIIEGVNTNAKNIIYFDETKGRKTPIDYFDYSNIKGRAGRMMVHLVGKIYNFNQPPAKEQIIIDIPFFEQNPITNEVLIHLDNDEIKYPDSDQSKYIASIPDEIKKILRNNGVSVKGQESIIKLLMEDFKYTLINWTGYPNYEQLKYILVLSWDYLIKVGETTAPMTKKSLIYQIFNYANDKSISKLIQDKYKYYRTQPKNNKKENSELLDEAIKVVFQTLRHWFQYKVPKWLSVINSLQEYVCKEKGLIPGNYLFYASMLENDFLPENLTILSEYNIPTSAIRKIQKKIPGNVREEQLAEFIIKEKILDKCNLIDYEKQILKENLN
ncbi:DEAD/DEAH box helicase [Clostridium estertheticum]|uniref:DEAD/DEAH box helicase n=1 Tax=Clostridium estertheticum TaxID=238834 RepID=UPI001C0D16B4|nr:DEAD/DEAH box helicase [Clostridium estertheticum]MBU3178429.1 DEAD/DEAH box helicase [Clostridium estertheticum]